MHGQVRVAEAAVQVAEARSGLQHAAAEATAAVQQAAAAKATAVSAQGRVEQEQEQQEERHSRAAAAWAAHREQKVAVDTAVEPEAERRRQQQEHLLQRAQEEAERRWWQEQQLQQARKEAERRRRQAQEEAAREEAEERQPLSRLLLWQRQREHEEVADRHREAQRRAARQPVQEAQRSLRQGVPAGGGPPLLAPTPRNPGSLMGAGAQGGQLSGPAAQVAGAKRPLPASWQDSPGEASKRPNLCWARSAGERPPKEGRGLAAEGRPAVLPQQPSPGGDGSAGTGSGGGTENGSIPQVPSIIRSSKMVYKPKPTIPPPQQQPGGGGAWPAAAASTRRAGAAPAARPLTSTATEPAACHAAPQLLRAAPARLPPALPVAARHGWQPRPPPAPARSSHAAPAQNLSHQPSPAAEPEVIILFSDSE